MGSRVNTHIIETESRHIFASAMTKYCDSVLNKGDLLFREITERDYGIDGQVELFEHGEATGRIAMIQLKGTEKTIMKLKTDDVVSCSGISKSNLGYCRQNNIPVFLVYCSTLTEEFYYIDLQTVYKDKIPEIGDNGTGTVRIPIINNSHNLRRFVDIINSYYDTEDNTIGIINTRSAAQGEKESCEVVNSYIFKHHERPSDGEHKEVGVKGDVISTGLWRNGRLINGIEFDWLIRIKTGNLIFKPNDPSDPYDATDDFQYEKMEQWGWRTITPFALSQVYIENEGIDRFFVVDMEVSDEMELMTNIRPLKQFLEEKHKEKL